MAQIQAGFTKGIEWVRGWKAGRLPCEARPTRAGRGELALQGPGLHRRIQEPASLTAGLGFAETGRKELSPLWALEEGSAAINSGPREGGS